MKRRNRHDADLPPSDYQREAARIAANLPPQIKGHSWLTGSGTDGVHLAGARGNGSAPPVTALGKSHEQSVAEGTARQAEDRAYLAASKAKVAGIHQDYITAKTPVTK